MMKPAVRKRGLGAGNPKPLPRAPFPEVEQAQVEEQLDSYIRHVGTREAFHLYSYSGLMAQQSLHARSLVKLAKLLSALMQASPTGQIKYKTLKGALQTMCSTFGPGIFCHFQESTQQAVVGRVADCLSVLLNHWRRAMGSDAVFEKVCKGLPEDQAAVLIHLKNKPEPSSGAKAAGSKALKACMSDPVSMDSDGWPRMLQDMEQDAEDQDMEQDAEDPGTFSPPPTTKAAWRVKVEDAKKADPKMKPSAEKPGPEMNPSGKKPCIKKKPACAGKAGHAASGSAHALKGISKTNGSEQSYIQHVDNGKKVLVVAVSKKQADRTSLTHQELIDKLLAVAILPSSTKQSVVRERDALFDKYALKV